MNVVDKPEIVWMAMDIYFSVSFSHFHLKLHTRVQIDYSFIFSVFDQKIKVKKIIMKKPNWFFHQTHKILYRYVSLKLRMKYEGMDFRVFNLTETAYEN